MNKFAYVFLWQGDLHIGIPLQNDSSELKIHTSKEMEVEIGEVFIELGKAIVPVRLHARTGNAKGQKITFEFEE